MKTTKTNATKYWQKNFNRELISQAVIFLLLVFQVTHVSGQLNDGNFSSLQKLTGSFTAGIQSQSVFYSQVGVNHSSISTNGNTGNCISMGGYGNQVIVSVAAPTSAQTWTIAFDQRITGGVYGGPNFRVMGLTSGQSFSYSYGGGSAETSLLSQNSGNETVWTRKSYSVNVPAGLHSIVLEWFLDGSGMLIDNVTITGGGTSDTQTPSTPGQPSSSSITQTSFTLSWAASTDNVGVTAYEVFRGTTSCGTTASTSMPITGLTCNTAYSMTVKACDAAGNWSTASTARSVATSPCSAGKLTGTIIGTNGAWGGGTDTKENAIDGSTTTFFDGPSANGIWVGLDLGSAKQITQVRFYPRSAYELRMANSKFQGSSTADFSSGVVDFYTIAAQPPLAWSQQTITNTTSFRYVRYLAPDNGYGNVAEVEFYGTGGSSDTQAPSAPGQPSSSAITETSFTLTWAASTDNVGVTAYEVLRGTTTCGTTTSTSMPVTGLTCNTAYSMTVKARDAAGNWSIACTARSVTTPACSAGKLTGTIIGTNGAWGGSTDTKENAMDGSTTTFFDGPSANGIWVGLDLGSTKQITQVRFYPRSTFESRMTNGKFQGSSTADFSSGVVDLYTIANQPPLAWSQQTITNTTSFRYVRYLSPNIGYGNVAEVEFYGTSGSSDTQAPSTPGQPSPSAITETSFTLTWIAPTDNVDVTGYEVFRGTTTCGTTTSTSISVTGLTCNTAYSMTIKARDAAGNWSVASTARSVATSECSNNGSTSFTLGGDWLDASGVHIDCHGGNIIYNETTQTYYWYGEHYGWPRGVSCYSSKNLYNWTKEGVVLVKDTIPILERPKVAYNEVSGVYAMWFHYDNYSYSTAELGLATSNSPTGPFTVIKHLRPNGHESRDISMYNAPDGTVYIGYAADGNSTIRLVQLDNSYLNLTPNDVNTYAHCEGPGILQRSTGTFYMVTSNCSGWYPNPAIYYTSDNITGSYTDCGTPCIDDSLNITFNSQPCYIFKIPGYDDAFLYMGDRWNGGGSTTSQYVFLPIQFSSSGALELRYYTSWRIEDFFSRTGTKSDELNDAVLQTEHKAEGISVYPNPAIDVFYLNLSSTEGGTATISLIDLQGKTIWGMNQDLVRGQNRITLDLKDLSSGLYLLKVSDKNKTYQQKVVIK